MLCANIFEKLTFQLNLQNKLLGKSLAPDRLIKKILFCFTLLDFHRLEFIHADTLWNNRRQKGEVLIRSFMKPIGLRRLIFFIMKVNPIMCWSWFFMN